MDLIHADLCAGEYEFFQLENKNYTANYVFIDDVAIPKRAIFIDTKKLSTLDYRKELCSKDKLKKIDKNNLKSLRFENNVTISQEEQAIKLRKKYIKDYYDYCTFDNLGKFSLDKILSEPKSLDKDIAASIAYTLDSNEPDESKESIVQGIKLLPDSWKKKFYGDGGNNELKPVSMPGSSDKAILDKIKKYNIKLKQVSHESGSYKSKQENKEHALTEKARKMRRDNLKKYFKELEKIKIKLLNTKKEYNSKLLSINGNIMDEGLRFQPIEINNIKEFNNLNEFLSYCIPVKEPKVEQQEHQPQEVQNV